MRSTQLLRWIVAILLLPVVCAGPRTLWASDHVADVPVASPSTNVSVSPPRDVESPRFMTDEIRVIQLLNLTDQRLGMMPAVAAAKWRSQAAIFDPPREAAVLRRARDLAASLGLAPEPVRRLFQLQARIAREVQSGLHEQWRSRGLVDSGPEATLAQLRPRLDTLTSQLLQALYLAAPVLSQPGFTVRYRAESQQQLRSAGWSDQSREELLEVLQTLRTAPVPARGRIAVSGLLRVGTTADYPPFTLEADGVLRGADIELAADLAAALHVTPVFIRTSWQSMLDDMQQGRFDVGIGGISVTPEREAGAAFSIAYFSGGKTIVTRCDDVGRFRGLVAVDRPETRVIVNPGGTNEQFARARLHQARIRVFPDNRTVFEEIIAGRADVMITDDVEVELQTRRHPELCRAFPGVLTHADKAILLPRDPGFVDEVNSWMRTSLASGEPARLLNENLSR